MKSRRPVLKKVTPRLHAAGTCKPSESIMTNQKRESTTLGDVKLKKSELVQDTKYHNLQKSSTKKTCNSTNFNFLFQESQLASSSAEKTEKFSISPRENNTLNDFKPFIFEGFVSLPDDMSRKRRILVLKDTGAS